VTQRRLTGYSDEIFGQALAKFRIRKGLSQEELGFQAGVHRTYVSQIERGLKSPTLNTIVRIARALNMTPGKLVSAVDHAKI